MSTPVPSMSQFPEPQPVQQAPTGQITRPTQPGGKDVFWITGLVAQILMTIELFGVLIGLGIVVTDGSEGFITLFGALAALAVTSIPWVLAAIGTTIKEWRWQSYQQAEASYLLIKSQSK